MMWAVNCASALRRLGRLFRSVRKTRRKRSPYLADRTDRIASILTVRKTSVSGTRGTLLGRANQQQGQGSRIEGDDIANLEPTPPGIDKQ